MSYMLTEDKIKEYKLDEKEVTLMQQFVDVLEGKEDAEMPKLKEMLSTLAATYLIPRVVVGTMRRAAEPLYIGSKLLKRVRLDNGNMMIFPSIGIMRAFDVGEGQEIPEDSIDWQTHETPEIRVGKVGVRVRVTQEMIDDSQWDVISMLMEEAGRAMARHKEQKCFYNFTKYGHTVFDNAIRATEPNAGTTGLAFDGTYNNTLSAEDFLDIIIAVMANEYTPSDILLHPLSWTTFAKNELMGSILGAPYNYYPAKGNPDGFKLGPDSIQGRIPFAFNVQLSPFIPLDKKNRLFDMYVVDRNNIGVLLEKEALTVEQWNEPARDIMNMKLRERYGVGILNEGKAVSVARNISLDRSFPIPHRIVQVPQSNLPAGYPPENSL
jgi:hypothetical protein